MDGRQALGIATQPRLGHQSIRRPRPWYQVAKSAQARPKPTLKPLNLANYKWRAVRGAMANKWSVRAKTKLAGQMSCSRGPIR